MRKIVYHENIHWCAKCQLLQDKHARLARNKSTRSYVSKANRATPRGRAGNTIIRLCMLGLKVFSRAHVLVLWSHYPSWAQERIVPCKGTLSTPPQFRHLHMALGLPNYGNMFLPLNRRSYPSTRLHGITQRYPLQISALLPTILRKCNRDYDANSAVTLHTCTCRCT